MKLLITRPFLRPKIFLSNPPPNTLSPCSFFNAKDQVSHPFQKSKFYIYRYVFRQPAGRQKLLTERSAGILQIQLMCPSCLRRSWQWPQQSTLCIAAKVPNRTTDEQEDGWAQQPVGTTNPCSCRYPNPRLSSPLPSHHTDWTNPTVLNVKYESKLRGRFGTHELWKARTALKWPAEIWGLRYRE